MIIKNLLKTIKKQNSTKKLFDKNQTLYIFLDIDGVLNTEDDWAHPFSINKICVSNFTSYFRSYDVKIILISSWKNGFISSNNPKNAVYIKTLEKILLKEGIKIIGKTENKETRTAEVYDYLQKHPSIQSYMIIDDDASLYTDKEKLNIVNYKTGFIRL